MLGVHDFFLSDSGSNTFSMYYGIYLPHMTSYWVDSGGFLPIIRIRLGSHYRSLVPSAVPYGDS